MTDPDKQKLDELDDEIADARRQAQSHGTIPDPDAPEPDYMTPGAPVDAPVDEDHDEKD